MRLEKSQGVTTVTTQTTAFKNNKSHIGTVNFISKDKADELATMGFHYTEHRINANQIVYQFVDTPELRKAITGKFANNEFFVNKTMYL